MARKKSQPKVTESATPAAASGPVTFEPDTPTPTPSGNGRFWNKDNDDGGKTSLDLLFEFYGQVTPVTDKKGVTRDMVMYDRLKGGTGTGIGASIMKQHFF